MAMAVIVATASISPVAAQAKTSHYVASSVKGYWARYNTETEKNELTLSYEYKNSYDKNGNRIKNTYVFHDFDGSKKTTTTKYIFKSGKLTKITRSDGTYDQYTYKSKKLTVVKKYNKKDKLIGSDSYSYSKKGYLTKITTKEGKKVTGIQSFNSKGIVKENKYFDEAGNVTGLYKYDSHGNLKQGDMYSYASGKKEHVSCTKSDNTYNEAGVMTESVTMDISYTGDYETKMETTYFESGAEIGREKTRVYYVKNDGEYLKGEGCYFEYKTDSNNNITEVIQKNDETDEVDYREETTWKKLVY